LHLAGARIARKRTGQCAELKLQDLVDMYIQQRGLCAYSGIPMKSTGEFTVSLERIDPTLGYTVSNTCLICTEFQSIDRRAQHGDLTKGSGYWSKEKVDQWRQLNQI
jgi:hypothetical protein